MAKLRTPYSELFSLGDLQHDIGEAANRIDNAYIKNVAGETGSLMPTFSAASGVETALNITVGFNQSGTAGATWLKADSVVIGGGSGESLFLDLNSSGSRKFSLDTDAKASWFDNYGGPSDYISLDVEWAQVGNEATIGIVESGIYAGTSSDLNITAPGVLTFSAGAGSQVITLSGIRVDCPHLYPTVDGTSRLGTLTSRWKCVSTGGTLSDGGDEYLLYASATFNHFIADKHVLYADITNTTSGSSSSLITLMVDTVSQFKVDLAGTVTATAFVGDGSGLTGAGVGLGDDPVWTGDHEHQGNVGIGTTPTYPLEVYESTTNVSPAKFTVPNGSIGGIIVKTTAYANAGLTLAGWAGSTTGWLTDQINCAAHYFRHRGSLLTSDDLESWRFGCSDSGASGNGAALGAMVYFPSDADFIRCRQTTGELWGRWMQNGLLHYNSWTDAVNNEGVELVFDTDVAYLRGFSNGTGTKRDLYVESDKGMHLKASSGGYAIAFHQDNAYRWRIDDFGKFLPYYDGLHIGFDDMSLNPDLYARMIELKDTYLQNHTMDDATGNEIASTINYTVNKLTSGDDTGLLINKTDTASPGTSLLADFQTGGVSQASVTDSGDLALKGLISTDVPDTASDATSLLKLVENSSTYFEVFSRNGATLNVGVSRYLAIKRDGIGSINIGNNGQVPTVVSEDGLWLDLKSRRSTDGGTNYGMRFDNDEYLATSPLFKWTRATDTLAHLLASAAGTCEFRLLDSFTDLNNYSSGGMEVGYTNHLGVDGFAIGPKSAGTGSTTDATMLGNWYCEGDIKLARENYFGAYHSGTSYVLLGLSSGNEITLGALTGNTNTRIAFLKTGDIQLEANSKAVLFNIGTTGAEVGRMDNNGNFEHDGYHEMVEVTAPAAPSTNEVRIYAEDNGSGKTRLMALFATGAAQQIAIEP